MNETITSIAVPSRSQRLRAATHAMHEALDHRIMASAIFSSRERFSRFLLVQYHFHRDIAPLYEDPGLAALLPGLGERARLSRIANDLTALGCRLPEIETPPLAAGLPMCRALGWLYVAEGSNLGGTILFKQASEQLGLHRGFGASHLAAHPDGAARHWRRFTSALDALILSQEQEADAVGGARDAFSTVRGYAERLLPAVTTDGQPA